MKKKLILHYFISFILACSVIFIINIFFMWSNIYNQGAFYNYQPKDVIDLVKKSISIANSDNVLVNEDGLSVLQKENIGLQVLDENNNEIFNYNKPNLAPMHYSNVSIIDMYNNKDKTLFLSEEVIDNNTYTYLLFFDANKINRVSYSYDVTLIKKAHHFPTLIGINIALILIMSLLFTVKISKPINRIIENIVELSKGNYIINNIDKGIYFEVEDRLNQLSERLSINENERNKLEDMREEWISNITHDIKTPLTSIIGNAEIMADIKYEIEDDKRIKYCNTIISKSEYIKTLIEDLNLSTRLKSNTLFLKKKTVNVVSLVRHILIDIINDEKYSYDNIKFEYSSEEIFIKIDEQLVKRVFINLITNAFIHNGNDVKINIKIEKLENDNIHISIKDNGKGVTEDELNYIFKRYYRGTDTNKRIEGSGLGMAIAHDIIKAHDGSIRATSRLEEGLKIDIIFNK